MNGSPVCGVCGVPIQMVKKGGTPIGGMYLCDLHRPYPANCTSCPLAVICNDRVHLYKLWVLCEMPTKDDFERMELYGTPNSVAYPFSNNKTLEQALFPMGGNYHGKQATHTTPFVRGQTALPDPG